MFLLGIVLCGVAEAQSSVWVYFSDKCSTEKDYFKSEVCAHYLIELELRNVQVIGTSKWLNAACISSKDIEIVADLSFVSHIEQLGQYVSDEEKIDEDFSYGNSDWQIEMMDLHSYHQLGNTGDGVRLALFDGGFYKVDSLPIFNSLWDNNQIIASYDFVRNDTLNWRESAHGMQVLALAGIDYPDSMVGASPGADFILARTEDTRSETHLEELNWLRAMEWADSVGVDIIHSSLGYSRFDSLQGDYQYQDMDGQSTLITIAAQKAAERGIFITNSAGNSGNVPWFYITAPCDGKDVLCVGAVDSFRNVTDFSSRGPSADERIKPDVTAMGGSNTIPNRDGILRTGSGTSFSGPLVAGLVACLKGAHPYKSNDQIFEAILQSADRYSNPNNEYGHGIPNALRADSVLMTMPVLGASQVLELQVLIYPNPTSDYMKIQTAPGSKFNLTDVQGKVLREGRLENWVNFLDMQGLPKGFYYVKVFSEDLVIYKQIVLE